MTRGRRKREGSHAGAAGRPASVTAAVPSAPGIPGLVATAVAIAVAAVVLAPLSSPPVQPDREGPAGWIFQELGVSAGLRAQVPPLDRVDSLMARGEVPGARAALTSWWESRFESAGSLERQRALWLRGKLTVDPGMARRDYLRLVLEHPGGPHSAEALLRLAQAEHAAGRMVDAARHFEQLLRDYPESPHRLEARRWLEENGEVVARARSRAGSNPAPVPESASPSDRRGPVAVQLGAFSSEERARDLVRRAEGEGIGGLRLVRVEGSRLIRVRVGSFPDRSAAESLRDRMEDLGFDATIVTDGLEVC